MSRSASPWCRCSAGRTAGYRLDPETGVWVCASCGQPTRLVYAAIESGDIPRQYPPLDPDLFPVIGWVD